MNKTQFALQTSRVSWAALVITLAVTGFSISWILAVITLVPLLLSAHGPIKGSIRGHQWCAFAVCPYFMYGVTEEVEQLYIPEVAYSFTTTVVWLASMVLFIAAMMHSRWAAQDKMDAEEANNAAQ